MQIRDAIHGDIKIDDDLILDVISSLEFQRLRKIKQLGLTYMVFPSAQHTRYSHSIGVYHIATKVIKSLEEKNYKFSFSDKVSFYLAALLHDLGHGPLSHTAELFFNYSHEDYSCKIIRDSNTQINSILSKYDSNLVESVCSIIEKKHENNILNKLLSGSVDIDRMDYLQRDSQSTGVVYGSIEIERLIDQMIIKDDELVFFMRSVNMIEDFIIARYQMFSQIYLNKKSLSFESLVSEILLRIKELYNDGYEFKTDISLLLPFLNKTDGDIKVEDYLNMDDIVMMFIISQMLNEDDDKLVSLVNLFEKSNVMTFHKPAYESQKLSVKTVLKDKIYRDSIKVVDKQDNIYLIEEVSQLLKFSKESMSIKVDQFDVYIKK